MNKTKTLLVMAVCFIVLSYSLRPVFGDDAGSDPATCDITITVDSIVEWEGTNSQGTAEPMPDITLADITDQASAPEGTSTLTLYTNSNIIITADNTDAAELTHQRDVSGHEDTLVTMYKISTDEAGVTATGATLSDVAACSASTWTVYSSFLTPTGLAITHYNTDGAVDVTLSVQATNDSGNVADTGSYLATQTLTATWVSDHE